MNKTKSVLPDKSKESPPLILITNDDGIHSPGLLAVVEALWDMGELLICAPANQQSGMSRAFDRHPSVGVVERIPFTHKGKSIIGYGIVGSPAFSVAHGVLEFANRKPDLCVSGINYGENLGMSLSCSGTVGAVMEAYSHGVRGISISLETDILNQRKKHYIEENWKYSQKVLQHWSREMLVGEQLSSVDMLNINIPGNPQSDEQRITVQSRQNYFEFVAPSKRDLRSSFALKSHLNIDKSSLEKDSDIYAVHVDKVTSVTPLTWDLSVRI